METAIKGVEPVTEESLAIKELDGRLYFEALPLDIIPVTSAWTDRFETKIPTAVLGIRG